MQPKRMFEPITINGMELRNRLVMPAIHLLYTPDGYATDRFNQFYWKRAEGGLGLIIVGGCKFDDYGGAGSMMSLKSDDMIPGYKEFTDGIHARGAKVAVQLYHAGRYSRATDIPEGKKPLAPSEVYSNFSKATPKAMDKEEIEEVKRKWAEGAVRAQKAGFDAVEIVGSAGYLISQFLSPYTNLRTDEYGGSFENRCRFPVEVIQTMRKAVGPNYPIILRLSGNDFVKGSNTNTEAVEVAKVLEKAGVDLFNVTGGWHETKVPQLPGEVPRANYTYLAAAVKKAVSVPVIACNRINDPIVAEELLALERCDLIGICRTSLAEPEWSNKAKEGRLDEIKKCVACNQGCLAKTFFGKPVECLINGEAGREYLVKDIKPERLKNILVVGAGPGGCEFAIKAASLGHKVTIWEKENQIGGQLHLVAVPPAKGEFKNLVPYYETMLKKYNVEVVLGKEATADEIAQAGFDEVVIATGVVSKTIPLPLECEKEPMIVTAAQVLSDEVIAGKNVVIVGGGSVGCETAQTLAHRGSINAEQLYFLMSQKAESVEKIQGMLNSSDRNVAIVEIAKSIGAGFDPGTGWPVFLDLNRLGVKQYALSKIVKVTDEVVIIDKTNIDKETKEETVERIEIPYDTIVLAVGSSSNGKLYEELKEKMDNIHLLGDAKQVGKIIDAVREADELAIHM